MSETLEQLDLGTFILIGHSLGGAMSLGYAVRRAETLAALLLISPAGARTTDEDLQALVGAFRAQNPHDARRLLARLYHRPPWFVPLLGREFLQSLARPGVRDILASAKVDDAVTPEELVRLTMPVFVIWGRSEHLLPAAHLGTSRANSGTCGHHRAVRLRALPALDDPAALADTIVRLLTRAPS